MPRVIDADTPRKTLMDWLNWYTASDTVKITVQEAVNILDETPTIDAEPVVRCKDCRWVHYESADVRCCTLHKGLAMISPDSFCSYGKRRRHNATD